MRVLVTGGTGLVGAPAVRRLLDGGHEVRLLSRNAEKDVRQFTGKVEPVQASITDDLSGIAEGCDVVIHSAGIVAEKPPLTFNAVNVNGTASLIQECERASVKRLIYVSSLGADTGLSAYHQSKRDAEALVRNFSGDWVILRPGNVYGPEDEVVTLYLRMVQTLPAVPVIDGGNEKAQPIWVGDLADAIEACLTRPDVNGRTLELGGKDLVSTNDVLDILEVLTHKKPLRIPVPSSIATAGASLLQNFGVEFPFSADQVIMLVEGSRLSDPQQNGLDLLGIEPTPIERGLKILLEAPEPQAVPDKSDLITESRYEITIADSALNGAELMDLVKDNFEQVFGQAPISAQQRRRMTYGETATLELPVRGQVLVRVLHESPTSLTCVPAKGHPLAGAVTFEALENPAGLLFRVVTYTSAATIVDSAVMDFGGRVAQKITWEEVVQNVTRLSGGIPASELRESTRSLMEQEADEVRRALGDLEMTFKRSRADLI